MKAIRNESFSFHSFVTEGVVLITLQKIVKQTSIKAHLERGNSLNLVQYVYSLT